MQKLLLNLLRAWVHTLLFHYPSKPRWAVLILTKVKNSTTVNLVNERKDVMSIEWFGLALLGMVTLHALYRGMPGEIRQRRDARKVEVYLLEHDPAWVTFERIGKRLSINEENLKEIMMKHHNSERVKARFTGTLMNSRLNADTNVYGLLEFKILPLQKFYF